MNTIFRNYTPSDYNELKDMIMSLYTEDEQNHVMKEEKILNTVQEFTSYPQKGLILIFETDGNISGYAILLFYWSNEYGGNILFIDELFIKEEWRSKGIGAYFFKYILEKYKKETVSLQLEVTQENIRARQFYKRNGFKEAVNTYFILEHRIV